MSKTLKLVQPRVQMFHRIETFFSFKFYNISPPDDLSITESNKLESFQSNLMAMASFWQMYVFLLYV